MVKKNPVATEKFLCARDLSIVTAKKGVQSLDLRTFTLYTQQSQPQGNSWSAVEQIILPTSDYITQGNTNFYITSSEIAKLDLLTQNILDGLTNANAPTAGNPFATLADLGGTGITTLNTLNAPVQTFSKVDDTNVTLTLTPLVANHQFALGWTGTLADVRITSSAIWNAKQDAISLTTVGSSGAATFLLNTLNIPDYSSALTGFVPYVGATSDVDLGAFGIQVAALQLLDTGADHYLRILSGEDLTSTATLTVIVNDTNRTLIFSGDADISGTNTGDQSFTASGDATAPSSASDLALTLATVNADVGTFGSATRVGQFTVNAKGLITAAVNVAITDITGNAATVTVANEATDTTCFINFTTAATGNLSIKTNASLTFNSNTANLGCTTFTGALVGNASTATNVTVGGIVGLGTAVPTALAVNVGTAGAFVVNGGALGTPLSGTLTNATGLPSILIANEATDTTCFVNFTTGATGELGIKSNANLTFNSNTASLACTTFVGAFTGNVSGTAATFTGNLTGDVTSAAMTTTLATAQSAVHTWALTQTFTVAPVISAMTLGSVLFAGASGIVSQDNATFFWDDTNNTLYSGGNSGAFTATPLHTTGTTNSYLQNNIRNLSNGNSASSDFIATADNGTDSTFYVDFGINSSTYNNASYTITGINDAYLYSQSSNLAIGTATAAKSLLFHTGGTLAANERMRISDTENYSAVIDSQTTTPAGNVTVQANFSTVVGGKTYTLASGKTCTLASGASMTLI